MKIVSLNLQDGRGIVTVAVSDVLAADRLEDYMKDSKAALEAKPQGALVAFDAGILNTFGGGDRDWWLDYIRNLLSEAHAHYQEQVNAAPTPPAREVEPFEKWAQRELDVDCNTCNHADMQAARKLYEARPQPGGLRKAAEGILQIIDEMEVNHDARLEKAMGNLRAELNKDKSC